MTWMRPGPAGHQRWRKRSDGAPAKIEISGVPGGGGGVLAGGIVSDVEIALRDERSEAGERAFPEADAIDASGSFRRGGDAPGFFAADAAIDPDGAEFFAERADQLRFEIAADAFGFVLADAETDGRARGIAFDADAIGRDVSAARIRRTFLRSQCCVSSVRLSAESAVRLGKWK